MAEIATFKQAWEYASNIEGWFAEIEAAKLWELCGRLKEGDGILEVGCYKGRSTAILSHFLKGKPGKLWVVDTFVPRFEGQTSHGLKSEFLASLAPVGCAFSLFTSRPCYDSVFPPVGLIHIDADHSEECVKSDCLEFLPLLRSGGWACFHDYGNPAWPGVVRVVDSCLENWRERGTTGLLHYGRKP